MEFFQNDDDEDLFSDDAPSGLRFPSPRSGRVERFDLNSDGTEFPNIASYQELLQSQPNANNSLDTSVANGGRGRGRSRWVDTGRGTAGRGFRVPRMTSAVPRGGGGARGASSSHGHGVSRPMGFLALDIADKMMKINNKLARVRVIRIFTS
ncbi:hypothetical protein GQ55_3G193500 [Panicum hallii var. hallii]|uniref:Uncharacterized protein n=1 Tax=Panicum hallii var. hallii TaxID=1504633 RepID=A0A2T7EB62_9POAL|nr:hypothetical protein GQ55_3G193500 [Panicum hallii var. hallii]